MQNRFPTDVSKFKLIVSDFDGTLAGGEHIVTNDVSNAVRKWISKGKHFSIATGRQYLMIDSECKKMGISDPVVVRGGAEVVDPITDKVLHSEFIDIADVEKIIHELQESGLFFYNIEIDDIMYSNFKLAIDFPKIQFKRLSDFHLRSVPKMHIKPIQVNNPQAEVFVDNLMFKLPRVHAIATHNNKFGKGWDITSTKATKLHGIVKVMELLNIERKEIVGVGDSYNDFPLLEAAHLKVAMGNAHQELKEIADVIVPSHEEDGVAYLIDQLLNGD